MKRLLIDKVKQSIFVILVALLGYSAIAQADDTATLLVIKQHLLRVYASGKLEKVFSAKEQYSNLNISPNQSYVVFDQKDDLWLLDVKTKRIERLTNVGKPYTSQYASISARFRLWTLSSDKILYDVTPGDTDDPEGERPSVKVRSAKYGFYFYDLKTKINRPIKLPKGSILFWLKDGNFLIDNRDKIVLHDSIKKTERPLIFESNGGGGQTSLSNDGNFILTTILDKKWKTSQIIKADMSQGHVTNITPVGKFAEYQWATFSPSGKRIVYGHRIGSVRGKDFAYLAVVNLVVDGRDVYRIVGNFDYNWIDNSTIAITDRTEEVTILNVDTKQVMGNHKVRE
ncbi:MAG: hypothetical protein A2Z08_06430 [Deltaproteobacteria bacterium RBG_16_54_11]|nr:MAG: hypothetical protein A2Z08_06430 [Deltaproteobacteria bacterium RBG_16_54_11]